jgi:hypothetical protein
MVREGYDFFRIQAVAGHASFKTTERYLAEHQLAPQAQREISATLKQIHYNKQEFENNPKPYATPVTQHLGEVIYKGLICDCKNVFDPPEMIKHLPGHIDGEPCILWNMCLLCPNVVIARKHLPNLVAYEHEIEAALSKSNLGHTPTGLKYQKIKAVLKGIFNEFGDEDLAWAREISECADAYVDPVTYRGVERDKL